MKPVKLSPLDVPYLAKCGGDLRELVVHDTGATIFKKGGGGPNSYEPILRRFGDLSAGRLSINQLIDWINSSDLDQFAPHLIAGSIGFHELLQRSGGIWRHRPSDERHIVGGLTTQSGVRGIWLGSDFRRACIVNLRTTENLSQGVAGFLLRACYEIFVRDEPSVSEPCVVDLSMQSFHTSGFERARRANVLTPENIPMMPLDEYELVLRRFWGALEAARVVPSESMPKDIVGTLFRPDPGLF